MRSNSVRSLSLNNTVKQSKIPLHIGVTMHTGNKDKWGKGKKQEEMVAATEE